MLKYNLDEIQIKLENKLKNMKCRKHDYYIDAIIS